MKPVQVATSADPLSLAAFDQIIDVRSPGEFALDHLPGAVNLPVLDDQQRAEVGTIYVQDSRLRANRIGAAHVARNIAGHLESSLADRPEGFRPLIYCWRGGQRSQSMATILSRIGWTTTVLDGGYRTYRRWVQARLYEGRCDLDLVLLDGDTGTGKTAILQGLASRGVQTLDLEALAHHRGSLFGALAGQDQPDQKLFESRLVAALDAFDPTLPIVVEAESSKIGNRVLPPVLWTAMTGAPRLEVTVPRPERARYLVETYGDITSQREALLAILERLPIHQSLRRLSAWQDMVEQGQFVDLADALMAAHYDRAYARERRKSGQATLATIALDRLDCGSIDHAVAQISAILSDRTRP
ncbi:tRNA 2-selenouridine(34) synthase MnmH [Caulobacter henricii]|uniref:tRNA 2-selenouridine synthase n=1 Tax=Caulobacter henricii TaxID=69395 RepID=A0A0N7JHW4_9CAUL|nr:tRNA 2-selenouridine(34) synthase MnmH [Caulobacter henricii]ALL14522.1 tRNA 2-selenouridine synthase [Caulobacter henricii]